MGRLLLLLFSVLLATPAFGISVNGYLNRAALENEAIDPSTTLTGRVYWNTTQSTAKIYTGSAWIPLGSGGMSAAYTQAPTVAVTAVGGVNPGLGHVIDAKDFTAETSTQFTFYNLSANGNDGSTQGINLTANGTPTYTTTNILGTSSAAATLNGTTQYYSSTNAFFNPGNGKSIAMGAWAYKSNWASATTEVILAQEQSGGDRGFSMFYGSGTLNFYGGNSTSGYDTALTFTLPSSFAAGWHHFAWVYNFSTTTLTGYIDGRSVISGTMANQRAVTTPVFEVGAERATATNFFGGAVEDAFFISGYAPTADDIRKLASRRLDHNLAIDPSAQLALATYERADGKLYLPSDTSWIVDKSSNSLWYDFSGSAVGSFVGFRLFNTGSTPNNVPLVSYDSGWLSAAPATTIAHGLGSIATNGNVCYVTGYGATGAAQCYPLSNYCSSDSTNLYCDWTGLSISSSNQVRLVAWLDGTQAAVTAASASTSGVVNTTSQTFAGAKTFQDGYSGNVPARAWGSLNLTSGTTGSLSSLTGSAGPSWITESYSGGGVSSTTGTVTFTINRVGYFLVTASGDINAGGGPTNPLIRFTWGGTATYFSANMTESYSVATAPNDQSFASSRVVQVTVSGQTVTINAIFNETATTPTAYGTFAVIPL